MSETARTIAQEEMMSKNGDFVFGAHFTNPRRVISWNPLAPETPNPHLLICGLSGSGKTVLLRQIIRHISENVCRAFVIDFHGDIEVPGEEVFVFDRHDPKYGISIFEFDTNEQGGGILNRIDEIIQALRKSFMPQMGVMQEAVLKTSMTDLYRSKGFDPMDPSSWVDENGELQHELPTVEEYLELLNDIRDAVTYGELFKVQKMLQATWSSVVKWEKAVGQSQKIEEGNKAIRKIGKMLQELDAIARHIYLVNGGIEEEWSEYRGWSEKLKKKAEETEDKKEKRKIEKELGAKEEAMARLEALAHKCASESIDEKYIDFKRKYPDVDLSFYANKSVANTFDSIIVYIDSLVKSRVFSRNSPRPTGKANVIRFSMKNLNEGIMLFLSDMIVQRIFRKTKAMGHRKEGSKVRYYIVIDESKLIMPSGKEKESPFNFINRIVSESRKFHLGIILVSQRINHYSEEILSNVATRILLKINDNDIRIAKNKLGIREDHVFAQINSGKRVAAVNMGGKTEVALLPEIKG